VSRPGIDAAACDGVVCDLDGVVYRGDTPIDGAAAAFARVRAAGIGVVFCTNNSSQTVEHYQAKLGRQGIEASPDEIVTSAVVCGEMLAARGLAGARALVIGGPGLLQSVSGAGLVVEDDPDPATIDVVAVGLDETFDYGALRRAALAIHAGAELFATNDDATYPAPRGEEWPGAGAILAAIEVASGRRAEVMGKPHQPMMEAAERRLRGARRIAMVGDRPETDLRGGVARGWTTILVLSGVTTAARAPEVEPRPDVVLESIAELPRWLLGDASAR
jgi:HAD superfamily hydrolase (TIGR01450 family)